MSGILNRQYAIVPLCLLLSQRRLLQNEPNVYAVKWLTPHLLFFTLRGRRTVKFENKYKEHIELPNPKFLIIHAAVAKVLHASGVGEYLDFVTAPSIPN